MGRPKKNYYFTKVHEQAIVDYVASTDEKKKEELYKVYIAPALGEMVDKIVYTYKFNNLPNIDYLKEDCKNWLVTILDKYDPNKGSKAFSYFSVTTKNWFIHKVKKTSQRVRRETGIDNLLLDSELQNHEVLVTHNTYLKDREKNEFRMILWKEINRWEQLELKPNEIKVIQAIKILFESSDDIEIFNKKAIYLYIREITGLNTKQVVNNLNKIRIKYRDFKIKWEQND